MNTRDTGPALPRSLTIRRVDPARNMARFYLLALQPTLFGDVSLVRNWGRIGTRGQAKVETFPDRAGAEQALAHTLRAKRRRGYAEPDAPSAAPAEGRETRD